MKKFIFPVLIASLCLTSFSGCKAVNNYDNQTISAGLDVEETESGMTEIQNGEETGVSEVTEAADDIKDITESTSISENAENNDESEGEQIPDSPEEEAETSMNSQAMPAITQQTEAPQTSAAASIKAESIVSEQETVNVTVGYTSPIAVQVMPYGAEAELKWSSTDITIASVDQNGTVTGVSEGACTVIVQDKNNSQVTKSFHIIVEPEVFETESHSINGVTSLTYVSGILIANKTYALPSDYDPGVDPDAMEAFNEMQKAAEQEGCNLYIASGYRSYETQKKLYERYVERDGQQLADTYSARPGHSEHQTGLAFDLNSIDASFAYTPEGKWVAENCYKYGFIIRYPADKTAITGYQYEPWHIRYLGVNLATAVYQSGLCLEEYLGITSFYEDDTQY